MGLCQDDLLRTIADRVSAADPFHLIRCFQGFCHAFLFHHGCFDDLQPVITGTVDFGKMFPDRPIGHHTGVQGAAVLLQVLFPHPAIFAERVLLGVRRQGQVREKIVSLLKENLGILLEDGDWFIVKRNLRRGETKDEWLKLVQECCQDVRNPREGKTVYIGSSWKDVEYVIEGGEANSLNLLRSAPYCRELALVFPWRSCEYIFVREFHGFRI